MKTATHRSAWHYLKTYGFRSIILQYLVLSVVLIGAPVLGTLFVATQRYTTSVRNDLIHVYRDSVAQARSVFNMVMREVYRFSYYLASSREVEDYVLNREPSHPSYQDLLILESVRNAIGLYPFDYLGSVYVYSGQSGEIITSNDGPLPLSDFPDNAWRSDDAFTKDEGNVMWTAPRVVRSADGGAPRYELTQFVRAPLSRGSKDGVVVVNIDLDKLANALGSLTGNTFERLFVLDASSRIVYDSDGVDSGLAADRIPFLKSIGSEESGGRGASAGAGALSDNGSDFAVSVLSSPSQPWRAAVVLSLRGYDERARALGLFLGLLVASAVAAIFVVATLLTLRMLLPIRRMLMLVDGEALGMVESEDAGVDRNEVVHILNTVSRSLRTTREAQRELARRRDELVASRAAALRAQIGPHFLYNTFQAISWLAYDLSGGENPVTESVAVLTNMLERLMDIRGNLSSLADEAGRTKNYVRLEELRFPGRFAIDWQIPDSLLEEKLPALSIQPLVENAIHHGIRPTGGTGTIRVRAERSRGILNVSVEDRGAGMTDERLARLRRELATDPLALTDRERHLGLRNVDARSRLLFGNEYGIALEPLFPHGLLVRLSVPSGLSATKKVETVTQPGSI